MGPMNTSYYWSVRQELGQPPEPRPKMPPIPFGKEPGLISRSETNRWLPLGYAVVHSCSPGTGWSQGCPTIGGPNEALAPKAVIDWLCGRGKGYTTLDGNEEVKADWCSGKVGMIGTSYNGTLPVAAATTGVEGLEAIIPIAPATSWYGYYRSNGLVRSPGGYPGEDMDVLFDFVASCEPKRREWCITHVRDGELRTGMDRVFGDYNDFWAARDYRHQLGKWRAATLMAHGFNDWNVMPEQSVAIYAELKQKGVPCMAFFHQEGHTDNVPFKLMNRWFTRFLHGVDNGVEKDPKAWIVREGDRANAPTAYADYPNPDAAPVVLRPQAGGNEVGQLVAGQPGQGQETLRDDPAVPGADLAEATKSPHRLLYATPVLTAPLHLSGTARLQIKLAADRPATNLSVWLVSLPWTGSRTITEDVITRGWADPQNRTSLRESKPLVPGEFVELTFDLQPDDQVIAAGERIGLMVFASDHDFTLHPKAGTQLTVDLAGTSLTLPVVGGADAYTRATAGSAQR
jgi:X-Pro dipeptidyl-peptidase